MSAMSSAVERPMRIDVSDLVGKPGATRAWSGAVTPDDDERSWGPAEEHLDGPIACDLHLDSVVDGILVRGTVSFPLEIPCARCLEPQRDLHEVEVSELFVDPRRREPEEDEDLDEGYEIVEDLTAIHLGTMLHDAVVMDVPLRMLCREDCQGLCPVCGQNRNEEDCGHEPEAAPDPRWAKLAELDLPPS